LSTLTYPLRRTHSKFFCFGPVSVSINPGIFRHVCRKKRQIVRLTRENHGILPGFGLFDWGLISVRGSISVLYFNASTGSTLVAR